MLTWEGFKSPPFSTGVAMYLVLKSTVAAGKRVSAGDVIELSVDEANELLAMGRVEPAKEKPKAEIADRSVSLESSDAPAVKTRTRKKKA